MKVSEKRERKHIKIMKSRVREHIRRIDEAREKHKRSVGESVVLPKRVSRKQASHLSKKLAVTLVHILLIHHCMLLHKQQKSVNKVKSAYFRNYNPRSMLLHCSYIRNQLQAKVHGSLGTNREVCHAYQTKKRLKK